MNWADDVNYMFNDIQEAHVAIRTLKQIAKELKLPFSKQKCKLVPMYPRRYPKRFKQEVG